MTHAFFKALLFLGAGSVIHGIGGEQDMRKMGGLRKYMPWTFWTMLIATLAISGIPPFAGFFSKDEILWQAFSSPHGSKIFWVLGVITAFMTSFYMFRLIFLTFFGEYRGAQPEAHSAHGSHDDHGHDITTARPTNRPGSCSVLWCCWASSPSSADGSASATASSTSSIRSSTRFPPSRTRCPSRSRGHARAGEGEGTGESKGRKIC